MSVRIKTEDGDLIVSGKGKDGKDGKDGGGLIEWFLIDDKHTITWDNETDTTYMASGTYYAGSHYSIYNVRVFANYMTCSVHRSGSTSKTTIDISKYQYNDNTYEGVILGVPKFVVNMCNIRQVTK